tara:strand:+ start:245 stop:601 length:357 start_codon:yes stop_codon:yes gene_type:complete
MILLSMFLACGESPPEPLYLTREYYEWTCHDYQDMSEIVVSTTTCDDHETGLLWLVAESQLTQSPGFKRKLDKTENWETDCLYQTELPLMDDYCIEVEGVTLTAYVEPATWSGVLAGD